MMFFDIVPGYVTFAHEWPSWIFLVGIGAHIAVFAATMALSTYSFGQITAPQLKWPLSEAMVEAPISLLAELTKTTDAALLNRLLEHGISARPDQTVMELAEAYDQDEFHILGLIVLDQ